MTALRLPAPRHLLAAAATAAALALAAGARLHSLTDPPAMPRTAA